MSIRWIESISIVSGFINYNVKIGHFDSVYSILVVSVHALCMPNELSIYTTKNNLFIACYKF